MIRSVRFALLAILISLALPSTLSAANNNNNQPYADVPSSVIGSKFDIVVDENGKKSRSMLLFKTKDVHSTFFSKWNLQSIPFTEVQGKKEDAPVSFKGSFADAQGNTLECEGTATGEEIIGSIIVTPKGSNALSMAFTGGKTGTPAAKKALEQLPR
jgi:hypothetical protein